MDKEILMLIGWALLVMEAGAATYYSQCSCDPAVLTNWNTNPVGGGSSPADFTSGDEFHIQSGHSMDPGSNWTVSGGGSKVAVLNGGTLIRNNTYTITCTLDIENAATLSVTSSANDPLSTITAGTWDVSSTVDYSNSTTSNISIKPYGNLSISCGANGRKIITANLTVNGNLTVSNDCELRIQDQTARITVDVIGNLSVTSTEPGAFGCDGSVNAGTHLLRVGGNISTTNTNGFYFDFSNTQYMTLELYGTGNIDISTYPNCWNVPDTIMVSGGVRTALSEVGFDRLFWVQNGAYVDMNGLEFDDQFCSVAGKTLVDAGGTLDLSTYTTHDIGNSTTNINGKLIIESVGASSWPNANGGTQNINAGSEVEYNSSSSGNLDLDGPSTYYNLTVSGGGNKTIVEDLTVEETLTLAGGNLVTTSGLEVNIGASGTTSGGSSSGFVDVTAATTTDGRLCKTGATGTMNFPIGAGSYRPVRIKNFTGTAPKVCWYVKDAGSGGTAGDISNLSTNRYWYGAIASGSVSGGTAEFTYGSDEASGATDLDASSATLRIARSATLTGTYNALGSNAGSADNGGTIETADAGTSLGYFALGQAVCSDAGTTVYFQSSSSGNPESTAAPTISIRLNTSRCTGDVTVDYGVNAASTATGGGTDYTLSNGTATIAAGNTSTTISPTIVQDGVEENPDEIIIIDLSNPANAGLGATTQHTYTIQDDEAVTAYKGGSYSGYSMEDYRRDCDAIMPVILLYFEATKTDNGDVLLQWKTGTEINNDYFTVECSTEAFSFSEAGRVPGAGNSAVPMYYSLTDDGPCGKGIVYYRLKQTDFDGLYSYSNIAAVDLWKEDNGLEIISVVMEGPLLHYIIKSSRDGTARVNVVDNLGRVIFTSGAGLTAGINRGFVNMEGLAAGTYLLLLSDDRMVDCRTFLRP